jgi:NAD-dependent dihydropyrimidine dehydrogenase PreA subunit
MPHFIGAECLDVTDRSCVEECPVDCIYEGDRKLYIHPGRPGRYGHRPGGDQLTREES